MDIVFFHLPEDLSVQAWRKEGISEVVGSFSTWGKPVEQRPALWCVIAMGEILKVKNSQVKTKFLNPIVC